MGAGHPLGGRDGEDNVRRVALWDPEAFTPTGHPNLSSIRQVAGDDSHLTEEETKPHILPRRARAGLGLRVGTGAGLSLTPASTACAQTSGVTATYTLGRRNPILGLSPWLPLLT